MRYWCRGLTKTAIFGKSSPFFIALLSASNLREKLPQRKDFVNILLPLRQEYFLLYKKLMASDQMLTTSEVAARLNVSLRRVRQLIEQGRLPSQQFGRDHLIKESDLSLVENRKVGRPPKAKVETGSKTRKKKDDKK